MARPGNTKQVNISLKNDLYEKVQAEAEKEIRSVSNFIAVVLEKYFAEKDHIEQSGKQP